MPTATWPYKWNLSCRTNDRAKAAELEAKYHSMPLGWAFSATHLIEHLGKTRCVAHHGMCWVNLLAALKAKSEHQICVRWMIDVRHARPVYSAGFGKGTSMVQSHASCATNTLRLSQGEQVQDLQAALAKAVKEANYLKAHWTLAAGLPCTDFVEDSFEVHWSTSLRYANVNNLRLS